MKKGHYKLIKTTYSTPIIALIGATIKRPTSKIAEDTKVSKPNTKGLGRNRIQRRD